MNRPDRRCPLLLLGLLLSGLGCASERSGSGVTVRDSAGIQIVSSAGPLWQPGDGWRVAPEPLVVIGEAETDSATQFKQVAGIVRLSDASLAVADAGSNTIRLFDGQGRLVRRIGRTGDGPGEFRALQSLKRYGTDSLLALDRRQERVTIFDRSGTVARIVRLPMRFVSVHPLADGKWLASEEEGFFGGIFRQDASPGLHRFPSAVTILDASASLVDTIGLFPGSEMAYFDAGGRAGAVQAAYGRVIALGTHDDAIYVGARDGLGYHVYTSGGRHTRSIRAEGLDLRLTPSDVSALHETILGEIGDPARRERFAASLRAAALPETKAAFTRLLVDPSGNVWLSAYETSHFATGIWRIFDAQGRYAGEARTPPQLRILEVGADYVAGVWKGELGVESVRLYALHR